LIKIKLDEKPIVEFDGEIKKTAIAIAARNFDTIGEDAQLSDIQGMSQTKLENQV
jgi:hypothetical protein